MPVVLHNHSQFADFACECRSSSPELYKAARTQDLTGGEFSIVDDSQDLDELRQTLSRPSTSGPNPKVGYLSDERMKLRSLRTQSPPPPEEAVRAILQVFNYPHQ